jgi:6-phosphogluconolactonase
MRRSVGGMLSCRRSIRDSNLGRVQRNATSFAGSTAEVHDSADAAAEACARAISSAITTSLVDGNICRIAFCGGNAARLVLDHLTTLRSDFTGVEFYLADERCVETDSPQRNDNMLLRCLNGRAPVRSIPAELGPQEGAKAYASLLNGFTRFDVLFLSIGDDGHVASIFPDHPSATSSDTVVAVLDAPKSPPTRISLSIPTMLSTTYRYVAAFGSEKHGAVTRIHAGWTPPAVQVQPTRWYLDRAAAGNVRG